MYFWNVDAVIVLKQRVSKSLRSEFSDGNTGQEIVEQDRQTQKSIFEQIRYLKNFLSFSNQWTDMLDQKIINSLEG